MHEAYVISDFEGLQSLQNEWNSLLEKSYANTIFLAHEWIVNWWKYFGNGKELFVIVVKKNKIIIGIAPLMITFSSAFGYKNKKIQFIGTPLSDYCDFIIAEDNEAVIKTIYGYLFKNKKLWDSVALEEIPENSTTLKESGKILNKFTRNYNVYFTNECLALKLKTESNDVTKILKKRDISRHIRHFQENGALIFEKASSINEIDGLMPIFFEQHIKVWDNKEMPSMFKKENCREFLIQLLKDLLPKNKVDIWILRLDQKIIVIQIGFNHDNKYITYFHSYDINYLKHAPSMILFKHFIEQYCSHDYDEIDFSRGSESYKYRFANTFRNNMGIAINKNITGHMLHKSYNKIKEKVIKDKKLHSFITKYKNKIRKIILQ